MFPPVSAKLIVLAAIVLAIILSNATGEHMPPWLMKLLAPILRANVVAISIWCRGWHFVSACIRRWDMHDVLRGGIGAYQRVWKITYNTVHVGTCTDILHVHLKCRNIPQNTSTCRKKKIIKGGNFEHTVCLDLTVVAWNLLGRNDYRSVAWG